MFKFIHAADLHLDSPLRGLERYEGAPVEEIRGATRRALENLVSLAKESEVDFVLLAGDLYDGDWKDHNTGLFFARQMAELNRAGIRVFSVAGNHDAQSVMTKHLRLPENVHQFPVKAPSTMPLEVLGVAVHGQGFAARAVTADLAAAYPPAVPGAFNIGLLHTSVTGREGHDPYAPCTEEGLAALGYDYWALGHVHTRECLRDEDPAIWFPGNPQGRHIREDGPKGCLLVTVDEAKDVTVEFQALDVLRWASVEIDISGCDTREECLDLCAQRLGESVEAAEGRTVAARVVLIGACPVHEALAAQPTALLNDVRALALDCGGDVWIEKVHLKTRALQETMIEPDGPMAELAGLLDELAANEAALSELSAELEPLRAKLPVDLREGPEALGWDKPKCMAEILEQVQPMLLSRLRKGDGPP